MTDRFASQSPNWIDEAAGNIVAYANFTVLINGAEIPREPVQDQLFEFSG